MATSDRRLDRRLPIHRPVKLQCMATGRYLPARTINVSPGGALVALDFPHHMIPGQKVRIGVARSLTQVWLRSDGLAEAQVLRLGESGRQPRIALRFEQRQDVELPAAA